MRSRRVAPADALELGEEQQHAANLHLLVETALFGQIADAVDDAARSVFGCAEERDRCRSRAG